MKLVPSHWTLFFIICLSGSLRAQSPEPAIAIARYKFSNQRDTLDLSNVYIERMVLMIGKTSSVFKTDRDQRDKTVSPPPRYSPLDFPKYFGSQRQVFTESALYFFPQQHKLIVNEGIIGWNYLFPLEYPEIKWEISPDTMNIQGYKCQKASGEWKGRKYTAWFCPELPFSYGPWKLTGLPGLILQAYDTKKQVSFEFEGFENKSDAGELISFPQNRGSTPAISTSQKDFIRLLDTFWKNPTAYYVSMLGIPMPPVGGVMPDFVKPDPLNNPIELKEIK